MPQTGPGSCRACLDSDLYNADRKAEADDDMEGTLHFPYLSHGYDTEVIAGSASRFEECQ